MLWFLLCLFKLSTRCSPIVFLALCSRSAEPGVDGLIIWECVRLCLLIPETLCLFLTRAKRVCLLRPTASALSVGRALISDRRSSPRWIWPESTFSVVQNAGYQGTSDAGVGVGINILLICRSSGKFQVGIFSPSNCRCSISSQNLGSDSPFMPQEPSHVGGHFVA